MAKTSRIFVIALAVALIMLLGAQAALAGTLDLIGAGWTKSTVTVKITSSGGVSSAAIADVQSAVGNWNNAMQGINGAPTLQVVNGVKTADINIRIKGGGGSTLGVTSFKTEKFSCILSSTSIQLSGKIFGQPFSNAGTRNVARREIGHALGLGHCDDETDLMAPFLDMPGITGNDVFPISELDKDGIDAIYPFNGICGSIPSSVSN